MTYLFTTVASDSSWSGTGDVGDVSFSWLSSDWLGICGLFWFVAFVGVASSLFIQEGLSLRFVSVTTGHLEGFLLLLGAVPSPFKCASLWWAYSKGEEGADFI